jgi:uncharacterized membrane protein
LNAETDDDLGARTDIAVCAFPLLTLLSAVLFASAFGCLLDEGSIHPCIVLGVDFGGLLYPMAVGGWFVMFTIPLAGLALIVWLIVLVVLLFTRRHRIRQPSQ